jgi:hypothetical protein
MESCATRLLSNSEFSFTLMELDFLRNIGANENEAIQIVLRITGIMDVVRRPEF